MKPFPVILFLCFALNLIALNPPAANAQATLPTIRFSSAGLVSTIQMTGTASWTYGSDQQTGSVTLQADSRGQSRFTLQLSSGTRVETQNPFADAQRQCTWSAFDGTVHNNAAHQCWLDAVWFLPQITMQAGAGALDDVSSSTPLPDGKTVRFHHERHPSNVADTETGTLLAHLSAADVDVDSTTGLPSSLSFAAHPDNDAGTDLPVEIRFSSYSTFGSVTVPTRIQKYINNSLVLDIQISSVQVQLATPATSVTLQ